MLVPLPAHAAEAQPRWIDVAVGARHACALAESGRVWCWGQRYLNGQETDSVQPAPVAGLPEVRAIAAGMIASCAIDHQGGASCWGNNLRKSVEQQAVVVTATPVPIEGLPPVRQIAIGYLHICALTEAGEIYCWGGNPVGEVGDGTTMNHATPFRVQGIKDAVSVDTGINNTCVVEAVGTVKCWGTDDPGAAMQGGFAIDSRRPERVYGPERIGRIANGRNYVCGMPTRQLMSTFGDGAIVCWGSVIVLPNTEYGVARLPGAANERAGMTMISGLMDIVDFDVGNFTGCVVHGGGNLSCWPYPKGGEVTEGRMLESNEANRIVNLEGVEQVSIGMFETGCVVIRDGSLECWHGNAYRRRVVRVP